MRASRLLLLRRLRHIKTNKEDKMKTAKMSLVVAVILAIVAVMARESFAEKRVRPFNRIVVMLDASGSFKDRRMEAVQKASELIDRVSNTKTKRYEGKDEVIVISLDSIPETIWSGTREQLKNESSQYWKQRFEARSDYQNCTDIENGFILAAQELHKDPQATNLYLFSFTDLINEPPAGSATKCQPVTLPSLPSAEFPWDAFADVETHVLWAPINQKQAWFEAVNAAKLGANFHIHSQSESTSIELKIPPKARHIMTEEEREEGKAKIQGVFKGVGRFAMYGVGFLILVLVGGMLITGFAKRKNRTRR